MTDEATQDDVVLITHVFEAPRERVFAAWTDPEQVAAWYGPAHMVVPVESVRIDARVGGRWEVTMIPSAGGEGFSIGYEILEISPPELLVMRSDPMPGLPAGTVVQVRLHDHGARTRMTLSDGPLPGPARPRAAAGYEGALAKLAALLRV